MAKSPKHTPTSDAYGEITFAVPISKRQLKWIQQVAVERFGNFAWRGGVMMICWALVR